MNDLLAGAVVMGPMTKGSNLPYRRLCVELGARVLVSEMVVARRLKQRRQGEFALIRRAPGEPCFGVQLAGNKPEEMAWAAALAESRGADFIDVNLGCPIDHFTRMGLGAALGRQPSRVARIVAAMRAAVTVPVTVKIRLGWNKDALNYLDVARAAVDAGAGAITVHGRTREARYRHPADWDAIAAVAAAVPVPVIGNGDLLFAHEIRERLATSGCAAVMVARGALIKPWIFREAGQAGRGYEDLSRGRPARDLPPLRGDRPRALGRRRPRARTAAGVPALARRVLVPLRAAAARRLVADDAAARRHVGDAVAARSASGAIGRPAHRLRDRPVDDGTAIAPSLRRPGDVAPEADLVEAG